jgi:glycine betaine/proline transport system substrate-binding protein
MRLSPLAPDTLSPELRAVHDEVAASSRARRNESSSSTRGADRNGGRPISRRSVLTMGAAAAFGGAAPRAGQVERTVTLGQVSLSFYAVAGAVVREILEQLGHRVEVREGPHEEIFPLLGTAAVDVMAAAWLPEGHAAYWSRYGVHAIEIATLYEGARFFWAVPRYVPVNEVASIADLARPSVARRMTPLIQSIGAGATITRVSQTAVGEYGLAPAGYLVRPGTPAEWTAAYAAAIAERRWMVFPTWAPQYLNRHGDLRPLDDPRGVLGGVNRGALVAPKARFEALPDKTRRALSRISLGLDGVTDMDWAVNVDMQPPRDAARTWMRANRTRVAAWLEG